MIVCIPLSRVIWWLFARVMTAKTVKGARTHVAVLGFQEFMNRVDAERLKIMPPTTFEKFLPYAMALGVEHHWAQAFAGIVKDPPQWYVAPGGLWQRIQSDLLFEFHAQHGQRYAPGLRLCAARKFERFRIWWRRWRRRWLLGWRLWGWRRQRVLNVSATVNGDLKDLNHEGHEVSRRLTETSFV